MFALPFLDIGAACFGPKLSNLESDTESRRIRIAIAVKLALQSSSKARPKGKSASTSSHDGLSPQSPSCIVARCHVE